MGDAGTAGGVFQRAIAHRDLLAAEAAARELTWLSLEDALALLMLFAEGDDSRYERAAVRWLTRLLEERELELSEAALAVGSLKALTERSSLEAAAMLAALTRRPRLERRLARGDHSS